MEIFNLADYVILAVVVISMLISLIRGFVREVLSLVTWLIAFIIAFNFCGDLAQFFSAYIKTTSFRVAISFAILFLVTLILGSLLSFLISQLVTKTGLSGTDRLIGMVFGFARGVLVIAALLLLVSIDSKQHGDWWQHSYFIPYFKGLVNWLHNFLPVKLSGLANISHGVADKVVVTTIGK